MNEDGSKTSKPAIVPRRGRRESRHQQHKVCGEVDENQPARGALEVGKGERTGAKSRHRSQQVIRSSAPVSWRLGKTLVKLPPECEGARRSLHSALGCGQLSSRKNASSKG